MSRPAVSLPSPRAFVLAPARFFQLAVVELVALWIIVGTGAAVRLTASGLGCRHWPGCERGHPLPAKDYHAFIEFGNRMVGGVVIAITILTALAAWKTPALSRAGRRLALALFVGALAQAPLGYLTVRSHLNWPLVIAHLLLSIVLLAGAVLLVMEARGAEEGFVGPLVPRELQRLGYAFVIAGLALVISGAFATAAGPHSGGGKNIDRFATLQPVVYVHATVVAIFLGSLLFSLGYLAARRERSPRLFALGCAVFALLLVQMGIGEIQWRTHLPWGVVLVHVILAATVWAGTVALAFLFARPLRSFAPNVGFNDA